MSQTLANMLRQEEERLRSDNVSGAKGVYYLSGENKWAAAIKFRGVKICRRFHTFEDAVEARKRMRVVHEEFLDWWDSLTEEEKGDAIEKYESEKTAQAALLRSRIKEMV